jgi:hypothetical protein
MKQDPWLRAIRDGGSEDAPRRELVGAVREVDGVPLQVLELSGRAGDILMTHIHVLHCGSPNARSVPRQMVAKTVHAAAGALQELGLGSTPG